MLIADHKTVDEATGEVVSVRTESITSNESATFGRFEGQGTVDKQTGDMNLGVPLGLIVIPGGNDALKTTIVHNLETGVPDVKVESVKTEKSKLSEEGTATIVSARTEYLNKNIPSAMEKFVNYIFSPPKKRKHGHLGAISHEPKEARRTINLEYRKQKLDSLKRLQGN